MIFRPRFRPDKAAVEKAVQEYEDAKQLKERAQAITRALQLEQSKNGYAQLVIKALGGPR